MPAKLRAIVRVREAVAASQLPELERGQDVTDLEEVDQEYRDRAHAAGHSLADKSYPILDRKRLHSAAVLAASHHGNWQAAQDLIRREAKRLGVDVTTLPGFGKGSGKKGKKRAAREGVRFVARLHEADVRKAGSAYEATILREGPGNPEDANAYTREALRKAVSDGLFEGLQAYADHPTPTEERERPERSVRQLVGHFREARYVEDGGRAAVRAKFVPVQGPGYEWVTSLIESALKAPAGRPLVGLSIDGHGATDGTQEIGGRTYHLVREITHLGSADIVTRAGAGGQFHRRLSESLAGARASVGEAPKLSAGKLQKRVREALTRLERGLADEDEGKVAGAFRALTEAASATVTVKKPPARRPNSAEVAKLKAQLRKAEAKADLADRATLAGKLLREVDVPAATREAWFDELVEQPSKKAMRTLLDRRQAERRDQLAELRESLGLNAIEGAGRRPVNGFPAPDPGPGLLERMDISRDELQEAP